MILKSSFEGMVLLAIFNNGLLNYCRTDILMYFEAQALGQTVFSLSKIPSSGTWHDTSYISREQSPTQDMSLKTSSLEISSIFTESSNELYHSQVWGLETMQQLLQQKNNDKNKIALQCTQLILSISFLFFLQQHFNSYCM